jgi:tRNA (guanine37-N1)-methyltransferase
MFEGPFNESIIKIAREKGLVKINIHNLRDWAKGKHNQVDDKPYGGGKGMVLMIEPIHDALEDLESKNSKVILLTPQGNVFNQEKARKLSKEKHIILIAGHYEGVDERVRLHLVDEEISIGDYVLTGGELPAMVVAETIARLVPGVLEEEATDDDSFVEIDGQKLLEYPQYTRPASFRGWDVEEILMSGDHKKIEKWQREKAMKKTKEKRPDLLKKDSQ